MTQAIDPTEMLIKMADSMGLTAADFAAVSERVAMAENTPTVAEFLPVVIDACTKKSLPTYKPHFGRLVAAYGDRRLTDIDPNDITSLRDATITNAATEKLERAKRTGRQLRSYEHDAHGRGAGENCVRACRFFFRVAVQGRKLLHNPAMEVAVPKRLPAPERPLVVAELEEVAFIWCTTGDDPALDTMMFEFHRKTAARREGGINLRLGDLDERRGAVTLTEKFGKTRELPYDADGLRRLRRFATSRDATNPSDHVFRSKRGRRISRKRYEVIYDRVDEHTTWTERLDLGVHWIRHTTLDDVRTVADSRVAAAYAGHDDASQGTIGLYNKPTFEELAAAFEAIFGPRFPD